MSDTDQEESLYDTTLEIAKTAVVAQVLIFENLQGKCTPDQKNHLDASIKNWMHVVEMFRNLQNQSKEVTEIAMRMIEGTLSQGEVDEIENINLQLYQLAQKTPRTPESNKKKPISPHNGDGSLKCRRMGDNTGTPFPLVAVMQAAGARFTKTVCDAIFSSDLMHRALITTIRNVADPGTITTTYAPHLYIAAAIMIAFLGWPFKKTSAFFTAMVAPLVADLGIFSYMYFTCSTHLPNIPKDDLQYYINAILTHVPIFRDYRHIDSHHVYVSVVYKTTIANIAELIQYMHKHKILDVIWQALQKKVDPYKIVPLVAVLVAVVVARHRKKNNSKQENIKNWLETGDEIFQEENRRNILTSYLKIYQDELHKQYDKLDALSRTFKEVKEKFEKKKDASLQDDIQKKVESAQSVAKNITRIHNVAKLAAEMINAAESKMNTTISQAKQEEDDTIKAAKKTELDKKRAAKDEMKKTELQAKEKENATKNKANGEMNDTLYKIKLRTLQQGKLTDEQKLQNFQDTKQATDLRRDKTEAAESKMKATIMDATEENTRKILEAEDTMNATIQTAKNKANDKKNEAEKTKNLKILEVPAAAKKAAEEAAAAAAAAAKENEAAAAKAAKEAAAAAAAAASSSSMTTKVCNAYLESTKNVHDLIKNAKDTMDALWSDHYR